MKLIDRLTPEAKAKLELVKDCGTGHITHTNLIESLQNEYWFQLTVLEANNLCLYLTGETLNIDALDSLFLEIKN